MFLSVVSDCVPQVLGAHRSPSWSYLDQEATHPIQKTNSRLKNNGFIRCIKAGVPGGLVGVPRAYQDQFCGFKSRRVHARRGFFCFSKLFSGKHESVSQLLSLKVVELGDAEPYARQKIKARTGGENGSHL